MATGVSPSHVRPCSEPEVSDRTLAAASFQNSPVETANAEAIGPGRDGEAPLDCMVESRVELAFLRLEILGAQLEMPQPRECRRPKPEHGPFKESQTDGIVRHAHPPHNGPDTRLVGHPIGWRCPVAGLPADETGIGLFERSQQPKSRIATARKHGEEKLASNLAVEQMRAAFGVQLQDRVVRVERPCVEQCNERGDVTTPILARVQDRPGNAPQQMPSLLDPFARNRKVKRSPIGQRRPAGQDLGQEIEVVHVRDDGRPNVGMMRGRAEPRHRLLQALTSRRYEGSAKRQRCDLLVDVATVSAGTQSEAADGHQAC